MIATGYTMECKDHTYIQLYRDGKFIYCYDNDLMKAEEMIYKIEKRTGINFKDIPIKGSKEDFSGLVFSNGGWKRYIWDNYPSDAEIKGYIKAGC